LSRQKRAAQFNYDLQKIAEDLRKKERLAGREGCLISSKTGAKKGRRLIEFLLVEMEASGGGDRREVGEGTGGGIDS